MSQNGCRFPICHLALRLGRTLPRRNRCCALRYQPKRVSRLDASFPIDTVFVIGDLNDDVDTSIWPTDASPYANFVSHTARYRFGTNPLSDNGTASTVDYADMIDHHLVSNESHALYVASSAKVYRVDHYVSDYGNTTSDHYPVLRRYSWSGGGGSAQLMINEVCANEPVATRAETHGASVGGHAFGHLCCSRHSTAHAHQPRGASQGSLRVNAEI